MFERTGVGDRAGSLTQWFWDIETRGKPDLLALDGCRRFDAEAVIFISKPTTWHVVDEPEPPEVRVYGAIWDS